MTADEERTLAIALRRMDALRDAIHVRDWLAAEFCFDQVASKLTSLAGTRGRAYDERSER